MFEKLATVAQSLGYIHSTWYSRLCYCSVVVHLVGARIKAAVAHATAVALGAPLQRDKCSAAPSLDWCSKILKDTTGTLCLL